MFLKAWTDESALWDECDRLYFRIRSVFARFMSTSDNGKFHRDLSNLSPDSTHSSFIIIHINLLFLCVPGDGMNAYMAYRVTTKVRLSQMY